MPGGRLTRKIGIVALGRAANVLAIYAVYALAARTWDKSELGLFSAVWVLSNTLVPIFLLGLPTAVLYFFPRRSKPVVLAQQAGSCLLAAAVLLGGVLYFWGGTLADFLGETPVEAQLLTSYLIAFTPYVFSLVAGGFVESVLVASDRPHWQAVLALLTALGLVSCTAIGKVLGLGPQEVLALFSLMGLLRLAVGYALVRLALGKGAWNDWSEFGSLLRYAKPIALNDAMGTLSRSVDRYIVVAFFGFETFAEYHLGAIEVPISLLLAAVVAVLIPEISRLYQQHKIEEIGTLWHLAVSRLALVALPLFFFLFVFADAFIALYLPASYGASTTWVFRIFLLALPLRCAIYNPLLVGMGKAQWALWGSIGDLLLNIGLSLALVHLLSAYSPQHAFLGPALATVFSTYAQVAFLLGAIAWHLRWGLRYLLPWAGLLRVSAFSLAAALVARWTAEWVPGAAWSLALGGLVFVLLLAALLWSSKCERQQLQQLLYAVLQRGHRIERA